VILSAWDFGIFDSNPVALTGVTDEAGVVRITRKMPFFVSHVGCEAAAPGKYAADHRLDGNNCLLRLIPLGVDQMRDGQPKPYYTVDRFSGRWHREGEISF
jgi:hypothetical protein